MLLLELSRYNGSNYVQNLGAGLFVLAFRSVENIAHIEVETMVSVKAFLLVLSL